LALPAIEADPTTIIDSKMESVVPDSPNPHKHDSVFLTNGINSPGNNEGIMNSSPREI